MNLAILKLHADDNTGVAMRAVTAGDEFADFGIVASGDIDAGHKIALSAIPIDGIVRKFGQVIGFATTDIAAGSHVHTHNVRAEYPEAEDNILSGTPPWQISDTTAEFDGYRRDTGLVGTRNYVGIVSTVNCSATVVRKIAAAFSDDVLAGYSNVDGIVPITHTSGCGMASDGEGLELLQRTLRGFIRHANFGGVLVIGLGCEVNDVGRLLGATPLHGSLRSMTIQEIGGTQNAIAAGVEAVRELLAIANRAQRTRCPAAALKLGLQCGGSDSFSAISANPALGIAADRLVRAGGSVVLAETPEIVGAENLLMQRAESPQVVEQLRERLAWWKEYVTRHGATLNNNPSPGNIVGGISTILEKSLGAVAKSGTSPLRAVIRYAETIPGSGFVFMDSPGYDPCSVTGEIASGANVICFTTGRGSVFGAKPSPSIKLATNSDLAQRMGGDIDFDCGPVLSGEMTIEQAGEGIFNLILETASGRKSASEVSGFGDLEFVPWQLGAVL